VLTPEGSGTARIQVAAVGPGVFSANATGRGPAAATFLRVTAGGSRTEGYTFTLDAPPNRVNVPIALADSDQVYLSFYGTGFRRQSRVSCQIGGMDVPVLGAVAQGQFAGLDQAAVGPIPPRWPDAPTPTSCFFWRDSRQRCYGELPVAAGNATGGLGGPARSPSLDLGHTSGLDILEAVRFEQCRSPAGPHARWQAVIKLVLRDLSDIRASLAPADMEGVLQCAVLLDRRPRARPGRRSPGRYPPTAWSSALIVSTDGATTELNVWDEQLRKTGAAQTRTNRRISPSIGHGPLGGTVKFPKESPSRRWKESATVQGCGHRVFVSIRRPNRT
jgi:hypothetical protein